MGKLRTVAIWMLLLAVVCGLSFALQEDPLPTRSVPVATLVADVGEGRVASLTVSDDATVATLHDGAQYVVLGYLDDAAYDALNDAAVPMTYDTPTFGYLYPLLVGVVPLVLLVAGLVYFVRRQQQQQGGANIFQMRRSNARLVKAGTETLRFADVGGAGLAKERLADVVDYLKNPARWTAAGVRLPRGVLLEGPPGCGKTLLARAIAGEAGVPVHVVSASEF
ncbi:MAG: AAA family ATPase, partial [Myxococcota bacterium]